MLHSLIRTGAALVGLAGFAFVGPAHAVAPMHFNGVAPLAIQVTDEGTYINEEERPNQVPPGSQERPDEVAPQPQAGPGYSGSGDAEIEELQRVHDGMAAQHAQGIALLIRRYEPPRRRLKPRRPLRARAAEPDSPALPHRTDRLARGRRHSRGAWQPRSRPRPCRRST